MKPHTAGVRPFNRKSLIKRLVIAKKDFQFRERLIAFGQ